ncbi:hypothetical protein A9Q84_02855 [Halobacteriovorax marinus]|uniref:PLD phosphodiesterase domain-containing protein n=1 Tax=Halobacteriovorax marinus TaxID=97084 RepID=A0A1Y5FD34_9BACT|nr:hypothetical protein A9Q84_02855 [Halobacteriovorax marinus]
MSKLIILLYLAVITYSVRAQDGGFHLTNGDFNRTINESHEIVILNDGYNALTNRLEMIERAQVSIDLETFIWHFDESGQILINAIIKKAKEGVKVRLLIDNFVGAADFTPFIAHELRKIGIEVRYYNPTPTYQVVETQWRNHKKSLTVDNSESVVGGRNIGDEYFDLSESYNFIDRDVWVKGPIVKSITESFSSIWTSRESVKILRPKMPSKKDLIYRRAARSSRVKFQLIADLREWKKKVAHAKNMIDIKNENKLLRAQLDSMSLFHAASQFYGTCNSVTFSSDRPISHETGKTGRILKNEVYRRLENVNESLLIESPYFILNKKTENILHDVMDRGVDTTLLTNYLYSTDAIYVAASFNNIIDNWVREGMNIYLYGGDNQTDYQTISKEVGTSRWGIHAKSAVFDDKSIMIGSFNFDPRSYNFSAELALFCNDNETIALELKEDIEQRMRDSIYIENEDMIDKTKFDRVGVVKRIVYYLLKVPSTMFDFLL